MSAGAALAPIENEKYHARKSASDSTQAIVEKLRCGKAACICVMGRSMWPSVRPGDLVFVKSVGIGQVSRGQIVAFEREGRLFVHRVLSRINPGSLQGQSSLLLTKGDSLDGADLPVSRQEFLGRVIRIHRGKRHIDFDSIFHRVIGKVVAAISPASIMFCGPLRFARSILTVR
ncbi:MAG TPA: S26 family signal peptidase [Candidatus Micrarchaeia archaeon]|nr:S26 family signal peptidase [Candidatus Micrarchaeia archaeon]